MSVVKIDLVRDTTMKDVAWSLAAIANKIGGFTTVSWHMLQGHVRSGLAKYMYPVGSMFIVEKETSINATVGNIDGEAAGITGASVVGTTFIEAVGTAHDGDYEFTYDGVDWHLGNDSVALSHYGITTTGTPRHGDAVVVHETAAQMLVIVIGHNCEALVNPNLENSMTIMFVECYADLQFCNRQALFKFPSGLSAGTYTFTIKAHTWVSGDVNKNITFTLTSAIPENGQLVVNQAYNASFVGGTISSFASTTSTTAIETVSMAEGDTGTSLGDITNAVVDNTNSCQRALMGSNNNKESSLRQLLNSDKAAGNVWTAKTGFDRPPTWASSVPGFMYGMDPDFVSVLAKVKKRTARNTISDGGGYDDTEETVFLLSRSEVYAGLENNVNEGEPYPFFSDFSDYSSPNAGADSNRIKYRNGVAKTWWLRTPYPGHASTVRNLTTTGNLNHYGAVNSNGVSPACTIA